MVTEQGNCVLPSGKEDRFEVTREGFCWYEEETDTSQINCESGKKVLILVVEELLLFFLCVCMRVRGLAI